MYKWDDKSSSAICQPEGKSLTDAELEHHVICQNIYKRK